MVFMKTLKSLERRGITQVRLKDLEGRDLAKSFSG